jgi:adenine-specific DNA-methyltransferase
MAETTESLKSKVEEFQKELAKLKSSVKKKKFGLVWMDVPESFGDEYENALPVLKEVPDKAIVNDDDKPTHILIEGDNYHTLTCLNYTHKGKIDVIYIDPPYNTGAKDWKYNNNYVDENDPWRHSKWINFMANRLRVAKNLLKTNGILICTIDENEQAALGLLLEDLFPKYKIDCITIIHNPGGIQGNNFSYCHEYAYFVYPNSGKRYIELENRIENADIRPLRDVSKGEHLREDAANCFYPILVKGGKIIGFGDVCKNSFHPKSGNVTTKDGILEIYPIDPQGNERKWVFARNTVEDIVDELEVKFNERRKIWDVIRTKTRFNYKTVWTDKKYNANIFGTKLLRKILRKEFPFPKSLYNTKECLTAVAKSRRNAIILDYFAGSGTTAHAVMEMNKEDGGSRQCIVCTNNENNICEEITYPRISKVINGYEFKGKHKETLFEKELNVSVFKKAPRILEEIEAIKSFEGKNFEKYDIKIEDNHIRLIGAKNIKDKKEGLGGSLKYYKTAFIGGNNILNANDKDKIELAHQAGDLLALAENTLYKVKENDFWQVYENSERYTAVYFREELDEFEAFVEKVERMEYPVTVYVFSWGDDEFETDFEHIEGVKVKTIPLPILEIYKAIYNLGQK